MNTNLLIAATVSLLLAGAASAHQQVLTADVPGIEPTGQEATTYYVNGAIIWEETNDLTENGVYSHSPGDFGGDTGIQQHPVCHGTFTQQQINQWNYEFDDHFGSADGTDASNNDLNYIPFTAEEGGIFYGAIDFDQGTCEAAADDGGLGGTYYAADTIVAGA